MATVVWYSSENIHQLVWPEDEYGSYARRYLLPMLQERVHPYVANVQTELLVLTVDGIPLPITVNEAEYTNSYVCSPYTHYVSYAEEELAMLQRPRLEKALALLLRGIGWCLRRIHFNRVVQINNWLVSTNLYPQLTAEQVEAVQQAVQLRYPKHVVIWRSLNEVTTPIVQSTLKQLHCRLIPSRQIYLFDHETGVSSRTRWVVKRDRRLIDSGQYEVVEPDAIKEQDIPRIAELYRMLYIDKYSAYNPQFTEPFFRLALRERLLHIYGLRKDGRMDAVLGFFGRDAVMTTPLFGYDTTLPAETGLYRMLSILLIDLSEKRGQLLHESSGVGQFKRNRGAYGVLEVSAVYDRSGSLAIRSGWWLLEQLLYRIGVPLIQKLKL
ncbi:GNAT family N-acetyltransferase [Paenibacillus hunanensis]|uniref:GNAT family N-acetyltransferase n=1 Tax=Paenibacillus hunanensis TaxID=539262 RepID=UPI00202706B2|nr:GNAT family N-acetyltransferase [Paenibacillus hunanensis]MCL9660723.1 GNAT family N-acetyltransferase [Paenibacillus hunanensis]